MENVSLVCSKYPEFPSRKGNDNPTGSIYPVFSRDSSKVQFFCIYDQTNRPMSVADSINHFQTGSFVFPVKGVKSMDSFFYNVMVK